MKELSKRSYSLTFGFMLKYYIHRIWRLSPPYWTMLMFNILLTKYLGAGPFFPNDGFEKKDCQNNWWYNMLYINNFLGTDKQVWINFYLY